VIDAGRRPLVPGFIDGHVHVTGGGGEGGFSTRTPELQLGTATKAGVTTVIGVLGTDGVARSLEALVAKTYGLREEGLSAWCYTGAYRVPVPTVTGDIMRDIMMIEACIGVGEVAISDHRSTKPSDAELARIASEARVAGMLSGKAGVVNVHLGDAPEGLEPLERVCGKGDLPRTQFVPTHCERNAALTARAFAWARDGGTIDFTASPTPPFLDTVETSAAECVSMLAGERVPFAGVTVSSDGQGSLPVFDASGTIKGLEVGSSASLVDMLREAVGTYAMSLEQVLPMITSNPARILKLPRKGSVRVGMDADLVILDAELRPATVLARGRVMVRDGVLEVMGAFV
jgi:beta-aspartyl-dipeptidase (metallo-type)